MEPGEVVAERYTLEGELGQGGMGAVYLAHDASRDRHVAVKIAVAAGHTREETRSRFEREARLGCALGQSPGFVRVSKPERAQVTLSWERGDHGPCQPFGGDDSKPSRSSAGSNRLPRCATRTRSDG